MQLARVEKERDQGQESDLQTRFHANLDQLRDEINHQESVERELAEAEKLAARFRCPNLLEALEVVLKKIDEAIHNPGKAAES